MGDITNIFDHRPHLLIQVPGKCHRIPVAVIEDVIHKGKCITELDDWEPILKTILREWLYDTLEGRN